MAFLLCVAVVQGMWFVTGPAARKSDAALWFRRSLDQVLNGFKNCLDLLFSCFQRILFPSGHQQTFILIHSGFVGVGKRFL
ncbi:MAG: hypothetical protein ACRD4O_20055, partial [Bryobacteraceae bacterium]